MFQNMGPSPSGRSGHVMAAIGNRVFVLGGESYTINARQDEPAGIHVLDTSDLLPRLQPLYRTDIILRTYQIS
jgi:hypothetical protein